MPELFEIDEPTHEFRLYEIEDTHPLTDRKLSEIVDWWCTIDDRTSWNVRLFVTDRYGLSEREIPLPDILFPNARRRSDKPATQQLAKEMGIELHMQRAKT